MFFDRVMYFFGEVLIFPVSSSETDECETWGQQASIGKIVDCRHHFLAAEITRDTEQDEGTGSCDAREPLILGFTERIDVLDFRHAQVPLPQCQAVKSKLVRTWQPPRLQGHCTPW